VTVLRCDVQGDWLGGGDWKCPPVDSSEVMLKVDDQSLNRDGT